MEPHVHVPCKFDGSPCCVCAGHDHGRFAEAANEDTIPGSRRGGRVKLHPPTQKLPPAPMRPSERDTPPRQRGPAVRIPKNPLPVEAYFDDLKRSLATVISGVAERVDALVEEAGMLRGLVVALVVVVAVETIVFGAVLLSLARSR